VRFRHVLLALVVGAVWGVNFVVIRIGLDHLPPLLFSALRFGAAAVPAVFFAGRPQVPWRWVLAVGVALGVVKFSLLFAGIAAGMPAGLSAIVLQSQAVFTLVGAATLLGERPSRRQLAAAVLAVAGLGVVAGRLDAHGPIAGFALVVAAAAAWGVANIATRKAAAPDALRFIVWVSAVSFPPLAILSLVVYGPTRVGHDLAAINLTAAAAISYIAWISTLFGFGAWGKLIRLYGASTVAPFAMTAPIFALLSSWLVLHERLYPTDLVGGAAVLAGVLLGSTTISIRRLHNSRRTPPSDPLTPSQEREPAQT
jgi:O-acetylserine/cysteine efflux transporter